MFLSYGQKLLSDQIYKCKIENLTKNGETCLFLHVSPGGDHLVADGGHAAAQLFFALGGLGAVRDLMIVEHILLSHRGGGEVGHDHVGPRENALLPSRGVDGAQSGGGGQEDGGMDEADDGQKVTGQLQSPRGEVGKYRILVGDEGADAAHIGLEFLDEFQVAGDILVGLVGGADHEAAAHLVADVPQVVQAPHPLVEGQGGGVEPFVVGLGGGLVAEQVAVGARVVELLVAFPRAFTQRQGHGAVGVICLDGAEEGSKPFVGEVAVLASLEDEGAEAQLIALGAGRENILLGEAVAVAVGVSRADAAVVAVILADIADLDEAADVDGIAVDGLSLFGGGGGEAGGGVGGSFLYE